MKNTVLKKTENMYHISSYKYPFSNKNPSYLVCENSGQISTKLAPDFISHLELSKSIIRMKWIAMPGACIRRNMVNLNCRCV